MALGIREIRRRNGKGETNCAALGDLTPNSSATALVYVTWFRTCGSEAFTRNTKHISGSAATPSGQKTGTMERHPPSIPRGGRWRDVL